MLEDPAEKRAVEALGLHPELRGVHLADLVAPRRPRHRPEKAPRLGELAGVDVDARHVHVWKVTQEDLGLRADAAPDLEQPLASPQRQAIVHHGLEEPGLPVQALGLLRTVAVQVAVRSGHAEPV